MGDAFRDDVVDMDIVPCPVCHNYFNKVFLPQHQRIDHSSVYSVKRDPTPKPARVKRKEKCAELHDQLPEESISFGETVESNTIVTLCEGMVLKRCICDSTEASDPFQRCLVCDTQIPSSDFEEHTLTKHGVVTVTVYKCTSCAIEFESESLMIAHRASHQSLVTLENITTNNLGGTQEKDSVLCEECNTVFTEHSELVVHRFIEHGARGGDRCTVGGLIQCHDCDEVFSERKTLYWHRQEKHLYRCHDCNDSFPTQSQLSQHIADLGPHQCQFDCTDCGASFDSKIRLKLHRDRHLQKFQCDVCKKNLSSIHSLNTHKKSKHSGNNKPFKCKICKKAFPYPTSLRYHMRTHGEKLIICQFCGLKFHFAFNYKRHVELNHGRPEDKVVCEHCGGLYSKVKLRDHLARHGEATLPCNLCEKKFRLKEQLQRHKVQLHKEKRPHNCPVCSRGFVKPENLVNHYAKKHREVHTGLEFKSHFPGTT